jgi:hypothetical protein
VLLRDVLTAMFLRRLADDRTGPLWLVMDPFDNAVYRFAVGLAAPALLLCTAGTWVFVHFYPTLLSRLQVGLILGVALFVTNWGAAAYLNRTFASYRNSRRNIREAAPLSPRLITAAEAVCILCMVGYCVGFYFVAIEMPFK